MLQMMYEVPQIYHLPFVLKGLLFIGAISLLNALRFYERFLAIKYSKSTNKYNTIH